MSDRPPIGLQIPTISPFAPVIQESFDLTRLEIGLSTGLGQDFCPLYCYAVSYWKKMTEVTLDAMMGSIQLHLTE
jgi:hypothetical protein